MVCSVDPCDLSSPATSSVLPALIQLASLAADLCANQVSLARDSLHCLQFVLQIQLSFSPVLLQLSMRLMTIVSLLQEWMNGTVAYHAAVHSELRSLEAIAAACDSMALLLLIQAV